LIEPLSFGKWKSLNSLNDIVINYTSADEKRYLKNLDLTNKRDLATAVPFISQKIKEICIYYSTLRDSVKTTVIKSNLKGSNTGIEKLIYSALTKKLEDVNISTLSNPLSTIRNNLNIEVEDLYDIYPDYYDINSTLPASSYNVTTGTRSDYFHLNQV
jgi:hypothetical protein